MTLTEGRLSIKKAGSLHIIDDTYNASPDSVRGALDVLAASGAEHTVAILGDMLELGEKTEKQHREIGAYAAGKGIGCVIAVGDLAAHIAEGAGTSGIYFPAKQDLICSLDRLIPTGRTTVLVKGSRGMQMEEVVTALLNRGEKA